MQCSHWSTKSFGVYHTVCAKTCSPGLAGDSKPGGGGGGGAPSRLGRVNGPVNGLSTGGFLGASCQKKGGGESVLYGHLHLVRRPFECQIILLLTVLVQLFELARMFCVDMAPCWRRPCHMHVWGVFSQPGGWSGHFWPPGLF